MRTTVLGSLLDAAQRNQSHGALRLALYESARVYLPQGPTGRNVHSEGTYRPVGDADSTYRPVGTLAGEFAGERAAPDVEPHRLAALAVGELVPASWRGEGVVADFFALKGVLEGLAGQLGVTLSFEPGEQPFLHPRAARAWGVESAVAFELDLAVLVAAASAGEEIYEDVTTFPAVQQDLAVVVSVDVPAAELRRLVLVGGGDLLQAAEVFDLYEGEQVGEGRKSLALRLEFRAPDRTLTDEEVAERRAAIEAELEKVGGSLRG
jgi:phenylalanyl-tRNA synthetase beta chain